MNNDRHARSQQPVQRLDRKHQQGERITYQDSRGRVIEADDDEGEYDDVWPPRLPNSSRRYNMASPQGNTRYQFHPDQVQRIPARRSAQHVPPALAARGTQRTTEDIPTAPARHTRRGFRAHPVLWLGVGMLLMFAAWIGVQALGAWWMLHQADATYGRPRTAQYDVVVGHDDSPTHQTHLIAMNLHARVVIIEIPGGDSAKAKIYQGLQLYGQDADLYPVTLRFQDVDGDGKTDMIVIVQGTQIIYLNQNGQFVQQQQSH
jgi:hypothetical protein